MDRRVVIGDFGSGTARLRSSKAPYDALTAPDSLDYISFDSEWTDRVQLHKVGVADLVSGPSITYADLGYVPFVDMRQYVDGVIYDDYVGIFSPGDTEYYLSGYNNALGRIGVSGAAPNYWNGSSTVYVASMVAYAVYKVPVPS